MTPSILHRFWAFIEETQTAALMSEDDATLIQSLTSQFQRLLVLDSEESQHLSVYVSGRLPLIRDMAQSR